MLFFVTSVLIVLGIFIMLGLSFNLLMGYAGQFSIAHGAFFGVGAYTTAVLTRDYGWDWLLAAAAGMVFAAVIAGVVGIAAARVLDEYLVIMTLALQIVMIEVASNLQITGRSGGLPGIPRPIIFGIEIDSTLGLIIFVYAVLAVVAIMLYFLQHSPFGRVLEAMREDEAAAQSVGKRTRAAKVYAFAISCSVAALAGSLFASYIRFVSPAEFTMERSIEVLSLTIIGGLAAYWGPFVGAAIVVLIPEILGFVGFPATLVGALNAIAFSLLVLVLLRFRPQGLLGRRSLVVAQPPPVASELVNDSLDPDPGADFGMRRAPHDASRADIDFVRSITGLDGDATGADHRLVSRGLVKRFGGLTAVDGVSITLEPGQVTGLVGPNGAGKTTVFNLLTGVLTPDDGTVMFGDDDISKWSSDRRARRGVVRSFQEMRLFEGLSVLDNILVGLTDPQDERPVPRFRGGSGEAPELVGRAEAVMNFVGLPGQGGVLASDLSYAEQKLLMVGRLIAAGAQCYLLDEPLAGLDGSGRERVADLIVDLAASGATVCLVEHSLEVIRKTCSRVVFLAEGRVIREGTTEEVTTDEELSEMYFGAGIE
ncbi:MAG: ATP-binding cassette domain-containing protein [Actinomycetota bacterium]